MDQNIQRILEARFLKVCSAQMAYDWLASQPRPEPRLGSRRVNDLFAALLSHHFDPTVDQEFALLSREDPLIDYALARFGTSPRVAEALYPRLSQEDRCVMRAYHFAGGGPLKPLLESTPEIIQELAFWVGNPNIGDDALFDLFDRSGPFENVDDEKYCALIEIAAYNPRLATPYEGSILELGDIGYNEVFAKAWSMAVTVPATQAWASALRILLSHTLPHVQNLDVDAALERWRIDEKPEDKDHPASMPASWHLRALLGQFLGEAGLESDDMAVRAGAYRIFQPSKFPDWPKFGERDGQTFVESAWHNEGIWREPAQRERLFEVARKADTSLAGDSLTNYVARERYWKSKHPEWFKRNAGG